MICKFKDIQITDVEGKIENWDSLHVELETHKNKEILVSLFWGIPHETEKWRLLKDVSYIKTYHGISILLEMEELDSKEQISLIIPNVTCATYDNSQSTFITRIIKYHIESYNHMNNYGFINPDPIARGENEYSLSESEKILDEHLNITGRIFLKD